MLPEVYVPYRAEIESFTITTLALIERRKDAADLYRATAFRVVCWLTMTALLLRTDAAGRVGAAPCGGARAGCS